MHTNKRCRKGFRQIKHLQIRPMPQKHVLQVFPSAGKAHLNWIKQVT